MRLAIDANAKFCEILGCALADLRGRTFADITYRDDLEATLQPWRHVRDGAIPLYVGIAAGGSLSASVKYNPVAVSRPKGAAPPHILKRDWTQRAWRRI